MAYFFMQNKFSPLNVNDCLENYERLVINKDKDYLFELYKTAFMNKR